MSTFASTVDKYDELQGNPANWTTGAFGKSSKPANDSFSYENVFGQGPKSDMYKTTSGKSGRYHDDSDIDGKEESILLRNMRADAAFGLNSPWGKQSESFLKQALNSALGLLGISVDQQPQAMAMLQDIAKDEAFIAPTVSSTDSEESIARKVITMNPRFFAQASTGKSVELSDFSSEFGESCKMPQGIEDMCAGNGLPSELAIPLLIAHMEKDAPFIVVQAKPAGPAPLIH